MRFCVIGATGRYVCVCVVWELTVQVQTTPGFLWVIFYNTEMILRMFTKGEYVNKLLCCVSIFSLLEDKHCFVY